MVQAVNFVLFLSESRVTVIMIFTSSWLFFKFQTAVAMQVVGMQFRRRPLIWQESWGQNSVTHIPK